MEKKRNTSGLKPWKKGQSGNPKGRPKTIPKLTEALREVLGIEEGQPVEKSELVKLLKAMLEEAKTAKKGARTNAGRELLDRMFGKVKTNIAHEGLPDVLAPITINIKKAED